ncbi:hypothetical protein OKW21_004194 [Catalinimonas alkaloidigena]|uniref:hypothetical protein n=1 Tax=Catalinimonas alkaloidigena TaxID=1075417 RepID=UPI002405EB4C|nr:hypothetical protein [Catalinimonas alkaloidigena]MDF9798931.1 hypothetical protein [Catalinimonas alkaloidigena]
MIKLILSLVIAATMSTYANAQAPIVLQNQRELFVDNYIISELNNVEQRLHKPHPTGEGLHFDKPWEGVTPAYITIIDNGTFFQMYYRGSAHINHKGTDLTCYAESHDGIHWTKPNLGIYEIYGSKKNNVIMVNDESEVAHNFTVYFDDREGVPQEERYKGVGGANRDNSTHIGLKRYVSPDGIHWSRYTADTADLFPDHALDSQNALSWDEQEQNYVIYFRSWTGAKPGVPYPEGGIRTIARSTSKDFKSWSEPEFMGFGDTEIEHLYTNATHKYFRAPQILISMPFRFFPDKKVLSDNQLILNGTLTSQWQGISDGVFMTSRGGNQYDRTFLESFIRPGRDLQNWSARCNIPAMGVIPTAVDEMSIYVTRAYATQDTWLERLSLRTDGFASISAGYEAGSLITKPLQLDGTNLYLNYSSSSAGYIKLIVLDAKGKEIEGFGEKDAPTIVGDFINHRVQWSNGKSLSDLKGKTVRLKFVMKDADLYSFGVFEDGDYKKIKKNSLR